MTHINGREIHGNSSNDGTSHATDGHHSHIREQSPHAIMVSDRKHAYLYSIIGTIRAIIADGFSFFYHLGLDEFGRTAQCWLKRRMIIAEIGKSCTGEIPYRKIILLGMYQSS